jgi:acyl-CoA dehydrogenase
MNAPAVDQAVAATTEAGDRAISAIDTIANTAAGDWLAAAQRAAKVAAAHADAVDRDARFPEEAFAELRREGLMSAMIPAGYGGGGLALPDVARICETLAEGCSSSAMIYAMHQIQVACIVDHGTGLAWQREALARIVKEQWLLASATSEQNIGGSLRTSACAVELIDGAFSIEKLAPTISYGAHADCILITSRRTADSPPSDQVLIVACRDQMELERRGTWDSLGMRGTCSEGFRLVAKGHADQILPVPFAQISDQTMLPVSHTLWAAVWIGIARDAMNRAHAFFRKSVRGKPGPLPPSATRLAEATGMLHMMQARLNVALQTAAAASAARAAAQSCELDAPLSAVHAFASDINTLKLGISTTALSVVQDALMICGMAGYKNGTPFSVGRHLRDLFSAPLMISNDRIALNTANLLLAQRSPLPEGI